MNAFKKFSTKPLWIISSGVILLVVSYFFIDNVIWWLSRTLQVIGIVLVIFGIIVASAQLNSKRQL